MAQEVIARLEELVERLVTERADILQRNQTLSESQDRLMADWVPDDSPYVLHPELFKGAEKYRPPLCVWAIQSVVLFNGDISICCFDASGGNVVGNAFEPGGFGAVWQSPTYRAARKRVVMQNLPLCRKCDIGLTKPTRFKPHEGIGLL